LLFLWVFGEKRNSGRIRFIFRVREIERVYDSVVYKSSERVRLENIYDLIRFTRKKYYNAPQRYIFRKSMPVK